MQSFLGITEYFHRFVPNYSSYTAPLREMTKKGFSWSGEVWTEERMKVFNHVVAAIKHSFAVHYPDYSLEWFLRPDASQYGVGYVLFQVVPPQGDAPSEMQPIAIGSKKFSEQATRWNPIAQEAYSCFRACKDLETSFW